MKLNIRNLMAAAITALVFSSCATIQVNTDYDKSKDFTSLKTYSLHSNAANGQTVSELNKDRILAAIKSALNAKGYTEVTMNPDFVVNVNTIVKDEKSVSANTDYYGYGGMYRPYGYWGGGLGMASSTTTFNVDNYKNGSIIIDMVDARTSKMFWEGVGNSDIDGNFNNPDQKISDGVNKILADFPHAGMQPAAKK